MDFIRYRRTNKKGDIWIKPTKEYLEMFKHCSGGRIAVTTRVFKKEVEPILSAHQIYSYSFIDIT